MASEIFSLTLTALIIVPATVVVARSPHSHLTYYFDIWDIEDLAMVDQTGYLCAGDCEISVRFCLLHTKENIYPFPPKPGHPIDPEIYCSVNNKAHWIDHKSRAYNFGAGHKFEKHWTGDRYEYIASMPYYEVITDTDGSGKGTWGDYRYFSNPIGFDLQLSDPAERKEYWMYFYVEIDRLVVHDYKKTGQQQSYFVPMDRIVGRYALKDLHVIDNAMNYTLDAFGMDRSPKTKMRYSFWMTCQPFFFGCECERFCHHTESYNCEPKTGYKICNHGWYPEGNCTTFCDDNERGATCDTYGKKTCDIGYEKSKSEPIQCVEVRCSNGGRDECLKDDKKLCRSLTEPDPNTGKFYQCY